MQISDYSPTDDWAVSLELEPANHKTSELKP